MLQRIFPGKNRESLRLSAANVIMIASAFIWYMIAFSTLKLAASNLNASVLVLGVNFGAIAVSGLLGSFIVDRFKKRERFLFIWIVTGVVLSLVPIGLNLFDINQLTVISLIFGVYFGLGMPATMGYHSSLMSVGVRAKTGGFAFLITFVIFAIGSFIVFSDLVLTCLVLASIRIIALVFFFFVRGKERPSNGTSKVKFRNIISSKSFMFYFVPWLMIALINSMTLPSLSQDSTRNYNLFQSSEYVITALVAVISGFVADRWGRKRLVIVGFVVLGIAYANVGLTSADYPFLGAIIYTITDGIAWGIFSLLLIFTLWGDIAQDRNSDKFYFLGVLPYVSIPIIKLLFEKTLTGIDLGTIFSFAGVFLFLAVLPLIYAPETLPEKLMKDKDLKSYVENAKKKVQKESEKVHKKEEPDCKQEIERPRETETPPEYDDAMKLAEKYY